MLYSTYYNNLSKINIKNNKNVIMICRHIKSYMDISKYSYYINLAPSIELLSNYKEDKDWNNYQKAYIKEKENDLNFKKELLKIKEKLDNNEDVFIVCHEKDYKHCHRYLILNYFKKLGYSAEEYLEFEQLNFNI